MFLTFSDYLFVFCATFTVKAQLTEWIFAYSDGWPHDVWSCPGNSTISQTETKVAFGVTGGLVSPPNGSSLVFQTIDRNLFATLTGGKMMGGNYTTQNCLFKAWGYGSFKDAPDIGWYFPGAKDTITATFSEPVAGSTIYLTGSIRKHLSSRKADARP